MAETIVSVEEEGISTRFFESLDLQTSTVVTKVVEGNSTFSCQIFCQSIPCIVINLPVRITVTPESGDVFGSWAE